MKINVFILLSVFFLNFNDLTAGCGSSSDSSSDSFVDEPYAINSHFIFTNRSGKKIPKLSKKNSQYVHGRTIRIKHKRKEQMDEIKFLFLKNNVKPKIDKVSFLKNKR
jgi:hypothetical protein